jgi:hypothetical protein
MRFSFFGEEEAASSARLVLRDLHLRVDAALLAVRVVPVLVSIPVLEGEAEAVAGSEIGVKLAFSVSVVLEVEAVPVPVSKSVLEGEAEAVAGSEIGVKLVFSVSVVLEVEAILTIPLLAAALLAVAGLLLTAMWVEAETETETETEVWNVEDAVVAWEELLAGCWSLLEPDEPSKISLQAPPSYP